MPSEVSSLLSKPDSRSAASALSLFRAATFLASSARCLASWTSAVIFSSSNSFCFCSSSTWARRSLACFASNCFCFTYDDAKETLSSLACDLFESRTDSSSPLSSLSCTCLSAFSITLSTDATISSASLSSDSIIVSASAISFSA